MDLYSKRNLVTDDNTQEKYDEPDYNPSKKYKKIQHRNDNLDSSTKDKIINRQAENEDIQGNENYPKKRYEIRKNKENQNREDEEADMQPIRSTNLSKGERDGNIRYASQGNYKPIQNYKMIKRAKDPLQYNSSNNRYNNVIDNSKSNPNENNQLTKKNMRERIPKKYNNRYNDVDDENYYSRPDFENSQNEFEISSIHDEDRVPIKYTRSPQPRFPSKIANTLTNKYNLEEKKLRYPETRSRMRNNQNMPRLKKQRISDKNKDDEIDELLQIID